MKKNFMESIMISLVVAATIGGIIGYNIGVKLTIERAVLVRSNDTTYTIEYNGQQHDYRF